MKIRMLVMDVDGTLTDGHIYMGPQGEVMKAFDSKDGYGIVHMAKDGVIPVIITGRTSQIVKNRAQELHIEELYQGVDRKLELLRDIAARHGFTMEEIAYIGDDENDMDCLRACGLTACPGDAVTSVKETVDYVCERFGGRGAVREFIEYFMRKKNA